MKSPLTDALAIKVCTHFELAGLLEQVARVRKVAVGSMFPYMYA